MGGGGELRKVNKAYLWLGTKVECSLMRLHPAFALGPQICSGINMKESLTQLSFWYTLISIAIL